MGLVPVWIVFSVESLLNVDLALSTWAKVPFLSPKVPSDHTERPRSRHPNSEARDESPAFHRRRPSCPLVLRPITLLYPPN